MSGGRGGDGQPGDVRVAGTILVIEDYAPHRVTVAGALTARGFGVGLAATGRDGLATADDLEPDLVLVDLGLPDLDGLTLIRQLLARRDSPIIVVTADATEQKMIDALELGAVDYVLKPFSVDVLVARVRRALRDAHRLPRSTSEHLTVGDVDIDLAARQAVVAGVPIDLTRQQFDLLVQLARHEGQLLTHAALIRSAWSAEPAPSTINSLRLTITRLRRQLGTGPQRPVIETEPRLGYRFVAPSVATTS